MASIDDVVAREILDSRGNPTVEVEVILDGGIAPGVEDLAGDDVIDAGHARTLSTG